MENYNKIGKPGEKGTWEMASPKRGRQLRLGTRKTLCERQVSCPYQEGLSLWADTLQQFSLSSFSVVLKIKPRALPMLGKHSITEPYPQLFPQIPLTRETGILTAYNFGVRFLCLSVPQFPCLLTRTETSLRAAAGLND
jgi:hypothetical protein